MKLQRWFGEWRAHPRISIHKGIDWRMVYVVGKIKCFIFIQCLCTYIFTYIVYKHAYAVLWIINRENFHKFREKVTTADFYSYTLYFKDVCLGYFSRWKSKIYDAHIFTCTLSTRPQPLFISYLCTNILY